MLIPRKIATLSLKCKGTWTKVDVHELGDVESVPADDGQYISRFCDYRINDGPTEYLRVGFSPPVAPFTEEEKRLLETWMPKAGLMCLIEVLCGQVTPEVKNHMFLRLPSSFALDLQKKDMQFFRERCRYDLLRVIHDKLMQPSGQLKITLDDITTSPLPTRLYTKDDLISAMRYWSQHEILIHGTLSATYTIDELRDEDIASLINEYDWEESATEHAAAQKEYDVFICHASEDKESLVRSLAQALQESRIKVWYDEFTLSLGDKLRRSIDGGLVNSRYGIVVLSEAFFAKEWPQYELDGLAQREVAGTKVILPIWHGINREDVMKYSPSLADRLAVKSDIPMGQLVEAILEVIAPST